MPQEIKTLLIVFAVIWFYRLISNVSFLIRTLHYYNRYGDFLTKQNFNFAQYTKPVTKLFNAAGVKDCAIPFTQPSGYGYMAQGSAMLFTNMNNTREDTIMRMGQCFEEAKGAFRNKIVENFSPLFWINSLLFLPRSILEYLGVDGDSVIVKLFQLIYWLITPLCVLFRDKLCEYILAFIN